MDLLELLRKKESELADALDLVRSLQKQIAVFRAAVDIANGVTDAPTAQNMARHGIIAGARKGIINGAMEEEKGIINRAIAEGTRVRVKVLDDEKAPDRKRNPRGMVAKLILEALQSGATSLDQIEAAVNAAALVPINRGSLRTQLMLMKNEGLVDSEKPGVFSLAEL
jgi:hypothetical protein